MRNCIVCGKEYTNPGTRCNSCRSKAWKLKNRDKDLAQRRAYNKRRWQKIKPTHSEKRCANCEKVFMPNKYTPDQPYCSEKCRVTKYRSDNKELVAKWKKADRKRNKKQYRLRNLAYKDKTRFNGNRLKALERDDWKCVDCGSTASNLNVHHKDHSGRTANPNHDLDNLVTLCPACHLRIHEHWIQTITANIA